MCLHRTKQEFLSFCRASAQRSACVHVFTVDCDDNSCQASQICRCSRMFGHERLTLSTAASTPRKAGVNVNRGSCRLMSVKPRYISQWYSIEGSVWRLAQHTCCRCWKKMSDSGRLSKHLACRNTLPLHLNVFALGFSVVLQVCYTTC